MSLLVVTASILPLKLLYITRTPDRSIASNEAGALKLSITFFYEINAEFIVSYRKEDNIRV